MTTLEALAAIRLRLAEIGSGCDATEGEYIALRTAERAAMRLIGRDNADAKDRLHHRRNRRRHNDRKQIR